MSTFWIGTSGYNYKEWKGSFYPDDLADQGMLKYYAQRFPSVEINYTFYRMPNVRTLQGWAKETPDGFTFTLKAPRRITHELRLRDAGDPLTYFCDTAKTLKKKLGAMLFQLPPFLKKDLSRLKDFLGVLPSGQRVAFEFRNESWQVDEVYETLRAHGAMLCVTDTDEGDTPFVATADHGYVRLRRTHYDDADLRGWVERIAAQPLERTYVYFMHEDDALGTMFAQRLMELWRERTPTLIPSPPGDAQGRAKIARDRSRERS